MERKGRWESERGVEERSPEREREVRLREVTWRWRESQVMPGQVQKGVVGVHEERKWVGSEVMEVDLKVRRARYSEMVWAAVVWWWKWRRKRRRDRRRSRIFCEVMDNDMNECCVEFLNCVCV